MGSVGVRGRFDAQSPVPLDCGFELYARSLRGAQHALILFDALRLHERVVCC